MYNVPVLTKNISYNLGKTLILVPHQDDETILVGGILKKISKPASTYVLFSTDGGHPWRQTEAVRSLSKYNIDSDNIVFMNFPDFGRQNGAHIYNATASDNAPNSYMRKAYLDKLINAIYTIRPDSIICIDYDLNRDHRALSLFFDEAIYKILKTDYSYQPTILKAFAYSPTWHAKVNFYTSNIGSTLNPHDTPYMQEVNCYN